MISSVIGLIKMSAISFPTFTHVMVPIMVVETLLDMALINWIMDKLEKKQKE